MEPWLIPLIAVFLFSCWEIFAALRDARRRKRDVQDPTVKRLRRRLTEARRRLDDEFFAEHGMTVYEMEAKVDGYQKAYPRVLGKWGRGPACINLDELNALYGGDDLPPDRAEHIAGCRRCAKTVTILRSGIPWTKDDWPP